MLILCCVHAVAEMAERHDAKVALNVARGLVAKVQELIKNQ